MRIGVPKETAVNERRVALTPEVADRVVKSGLAVLVERDAGAAASFGDDGYRAAGATVVATAAEIFGQSDVVLKVQPPSTDEVRLCRAGAALVDQIRGDGIDILVDLTMHMSNSRLRVFA